MGGAEARPLGRGGLSDWAGPQRGRGGSDRKSRPPLARGRSDVWRRPSSRPRPGPPPSSPGLSAQQRSPAWRTRPEEMTERRLLGPGPGLGLVHQLDQMARAGARPRLVLAHNQGNLNMNKLLSTIKNNIKGLKRERRHCVHFSLQYLELAQFQPHSRWTRHKSFKILCGDDNLYLL